jgi:translation initiation factor 3 subunit D
MFCKVMISNYSYVSRTNPKDNRKHIVLGVGNYKPKEFIQQMNMNLNNGWGILRYIIDLCLRQAENGKYILVKDPNKPILRFYKVPDSAFEDDDDEEEIADNDADDE